MELRQRLAPSLGSKSTFSCMKNLRVLPFCDDYLFLFESREAALLGREQIEVTCRWLG